jgi:hypothetical protein
LAFKHLPEAPVSLLQIVAVCILRAARVSTSPFTFGHSTSERKSAG